MHPTDLRSKYEHVVRDYIILWGSDISNEIEYSVSINKDGVQILIGVNTYDGNRIAVYPQIREVFTTKSTVETVVKEALEDIRSKLDTLSAKELSGETPLEA
jgi:hypothetical protein